VSGFYVNVFFSVGLLLGIVAQVIAYRTGNRTRARFAGMWFAILAIGLLFVAGQIAGAKLRDYANFIAANSNLRL
jgi:hypothetical protein